MPSPRQMARPAAAAAAAAVTGGGSCCCQAGQGAAEVRRRKVGRSIAPGRQGPAAPPRVPASPFVMPAEGETDGGIAALPTGREVELTELPPESQIKFLGITFSLRRVKLC